MNIDEKIYSAELKEKDKDWDNAIKLYQEIVKEDGSVNNLSKLGWCFSRNADYKNAIDVFKILAEKEPKMAKWRYMIGYQYYSQQKWKKAIEYFEEAIEIKPDYFVVKYRVSYAYIQLAGAYKKLTKSEFWKALAHIKDCHEIWKKYDDRIREKEKNTYFDINFLHGKILMDLPNHRREAILHFRDALNIKNDDICRYNLAKTYYLNAEYNLAKKNIPKTNTYYVIELNAYIDAKLGNYDDAINQINKLLKRRNKDYLYAFLADVYLLKNEQEEALKFIKQAININDKSHKSYFILAKVYYSFGLYDSALNALEKAKKIKIKVYNSEYQESIELENKINREKSSDYIENMELLKKIEENTQENYKIGIIEKYNNDRGYGFIKYDSDNIFFHISNCEFRNPKDNIKVKFKIKNGTNKKEAVAIMRVNNF